MNFNVVEREAIVIDDIYDEIKYKYLNTDIPSESIRKEYGLSHCDWRDINQKIKQEEGLQHRFSKGAKYFVEKPTGFHIVKSIKGRKLDFGTVPSQEIAIKLVELCKKAKWDIDVCSDIVKNWKQYVN